MKTVSPKLLRLWVSSFVALSLADLGLTWWLLEVKSQSVYEANPIAAWVLHTFGWVGLAGFKSFVVLLIVGILGLIARQRPQTARRVLQLGCALMLFVVSYSIALASGTTVVDPEDQRLLQQQQTWARKLTGDRVRNHDFRARLDYLRRAILRGEISFAKALDQLSQDPLVQDPRWVRAHQAIYPGLTLRQVLRKRLHEAIKDCTDTRQQTSAPHRPSVL